MHSAECVIIKILRPNRRKAAWLDTMANQFSQAVQMGLDTARAEHISNRNRLHKVVYYPARQQFGLPGTYARMAVNAAVALARSYYGLRKMGQQASFPKVSNSQGIGIGVDVYKIIRKNDRFILRVSTGVRGQYIWLPLCVPVRYQLSISLVYGDARLFKRRSQWYVMLPIRVNHTPTGCSSEHMFIGVDLGIVQHAVVVTPDKTVFFSGKEARRKREHFAALQQRYRKHHRVDRIRDQGGKEHNWMDDLNHKISCQIVDLASEYSNPVIVLERLDGIRYRTRGSRRFNRMMASWSFRDLINKIEYKSRRLAIPVIFVNPRGTSKTCSMCGHDTRSNRPNQATFRCVACGYCTNADRNAARNIAALGPGALAQEPSDTARPDKPD